MIETISNDLYRLEIPLPDSPLKSVNAYLIKGVQRHLRVDTGFNRKECREALSGALSFLQVPMRDIDFFVTHLHADHFGMVTELVENGNRVFFNRPDAEILQSWNGFDSVQDPGKSFRSCKNGLQQAKSSRI